MRTNAHRTPLKAIVLRCLLGLGTLVLPRHAFFTLCPSRRQLANLPYKLSPIMSSSEKSEVPIYLHHTAIKTRDIETCIQFYSLFGFEVDTKFRAGSERAAWLSHDHGTRLEVLELPTSLLNEPSGLKRRALDLMQHPQLLGFNHLALDVTESMRVNKVTELQGWLDRLNETSLTTFGKTLRIAVPPRQQIIGNGVYQLAFLYDADGALVELIRKQCILEQPMDDGWAPWDANDVQLSLDFDPENSKE